MMAYGDPRTDVKKEKIEGHDVVFSVDGDGVWYASAAVLEYPVHAKTIIEARAKVTSKLRRATAKLEIKAHLVNVLPESEGVKEWYNRSDKIKANLLRPITLTGIAQRSNDVMFTFDDSGAKSKKSRHQAHSDPDSVGVVCRRLTVPEQAEYRKLRDEYDYAVSSLDSWIRDHKIADVAAFLEEKITEAVDRVDVEEPATADPRVQAPKRGRRAKA
jgi:hypothetical protein